MKLVDLKELHPFGFALQNANVSRIFQTLGANIDDIPILWVAAPLTGLIVQPIIGYMSDKTWNSLGRRRPYFLYGAIATSLAINVFRYFDSTFSGSDAKS
jgi:maltose/moltooligosaccharide transporter